MSGIAGIFHRDGRPVDVAHLVDMTDTMSHRGPDGIERSVAGPLGMAHCLLRTLPDSREESQPLWDESGDLCLTLDGRIDNRRELFGELRWGKSAGRGDADAELLIRAYQRWGTDCIARIVGDFSFALWDGRLRRLVCARDFLGKRPLYYHCDGSSFRWASEPQAVLADRSVPRKPNEGMIGEFLSSNPRSTTETVFRDLFRLAPAHFLVVTADRIAINRYWGWEPGTPVRYNDQREYGEHFLALCGEAAEARLQTRSSVALELSGGVDSSSLVGIVEHLRRAGRHQTPLQTYSLVFPGRTCDETSYIRAVARHCNVANHEITPAPVPAEFYEAQASRYLDLPAYPNGIMHRPLWLAARARGCRVSLSGSGPDGWLDGGLPLHADLLRRLELRRLGTDLQSAASALGWRAALGQLWQYGIKPQAPSWLRRPLARAVGRTPCPRWLQDSFCRDASLADRLQAVELPAHPGAGLLDDGWLTHATESHERDVAAVAMQGRDPFDDRRVVEYSLALPESQRQRDNVTKYVLRQAMTGLIPESVRTRSDKAEFSHVIRDELRLHGGPALFQGMAMEDLGWVDGGRVRAMYDAFERGYRPGFGPNNGEHVWQLWLITSVERWLAFV